MFWYVINAYLKTKENRADFYVFLNVTKINSTRMEKWFKKTKKILLTDFHLILAKERKEYTTKWHSNAKTTSAQNKLNFRTMCDIWNMIAKLQHIATVSFQVLIQSKFIRNIASFPDNFQLFGETWTSCTSRRMKSSTQKWICKIKDSMKMKNTNVKGGF